MYRGTKYQTYQEYLYSPEWERVKKKALEGWVFRRKKKRCLFCHTPVDLNFHHLTYNRVGTRHEWKDLRILCKQHHYQCHKFLFLKLPNNTRWIYLRYYQMRVWYFVKLNFVNKRKVRILTA